MTEYVAGLLFSTDRTSVALIRKNRPGWQAGRWNAIGGHIERKTANCKCFNISCDMGGFDPCICPWETPLEAMRREFEEEAGVSLPCREFTEQWEPFCILRGDSWRVHFFRAFSSAIYNLESVTDEQVETFAVDDLPTTVMTNIPWLIQMALSMDKERATAFTVQEVA